MHSDDLEAYGKKYYHDIEVKFTCAVLKKKTNGFLGWLMDGLKKPTGKPHGVN